MSSAILFLATLLVGCFDKTTTESYENEIEALAGFIEISGNMLYLAPVEVFVLYNANDEFGFVRDTSLRSITFIEWNNSEKLEMFELSIYDFPNGYHMRPNRHSDEHWNYLTQTGAEILTFEITSNTEFIFVDSLLLFDTIPDGSRLRTTNILDEFMQYLFHTVVHFIEVYDGRIIRLVQEFGFTL